MTHLSEAIDLYEKAVKASPGGNRTPPSLFGLASCLIERNRNRHDLDKAIEILQKVSTRTNPLSSIHTAALALLGRAQCQRLESEQEPSRRELQAAVSTYRRVCTQLAKANPRAALIAAREWCSWAIKRGAWEEATEASDLGLVLSDAFVRERWARQDLQAWLHDARGLSTDAAYAWAALGDSTRAAIAVERGRAILLAMAMDSRTILGRLESSGHGDLANEYLGAAGRLAKLELAEGQPAHPGLITQARERAEADLDSAIAAIRSLPGCSGFLVRPSDDELLGRIVAEARLAPIIYLISSSSGGLAIIIRQTGSISTVALPHLARPELDEWIDKYLAAYDGRRRDPVEWRVVLAATTGWLWGAIVGPVIDALVADNASERPVRFVVVPTGNLAILPIHAASAAPQDEDIPGRCALDECLITYSPSAWVLREARSRLAAASSDDILVVEEPLPVSSWPLLGAANEAAAAAAAFPRRVQIRHSEATRSRVLEALPGHSVVHFCCHGFAEPSDPLSGALLMSNDEQIVVGDLIERQLVGTRLAVLSACETNFPGVIAVDEVVSMATAFVQAGAAGAVATLWSVDDLSTMVLMSRFYTEWRTNGHQPEDALRRAQIWLRDLTVAERASAYPAIDFEGSGEADGRPYANPHWWAGFTYTGA